MPRKPRKKKLTWKVGQKRQGFILGSPTDKRANYPSDGPLQPPLRRYVVTEPHPAKKEAGYDWGGKVFEQSTDGGVTWKETDDDYPYGVMESWPSELIEDAPKAETKQVEAITMVSDAEFAVAFTAAAKPILIALGTDGVFHKVETDETAKAKQTKETAMTKEKIGQHWKLKTAQGTYKAGAEVIIRLVNHGGGGQVHYQGEEDASELRSVKSGTMETIATLLDDDEVELEEGEGAAKKKTKKKFEDLTVVREGSQVVLPKGMTTRKAIKWLERIAEEDERTVRVYHEIKCYPIEGAYALYRALRNKYGFISLAATPSFFGENPPIMVGFNVDIGEQVQVPWGRIMIPNVSGFLATSGNIKPNGEFVFVLAGETKRKDEDEMNELVSLVKEFATEKSIYKGKAIRVKFPSKEDIEAERFDFTYTPEFIDTRKTRVEELVFPGDVQDMVNTTLFAPIEKTALCRRLEVPLKRGILLEGPFGTGKTLTAYVTAKKCVENGWTFMYLADTLDLGKAIMLARNYQPCAIFAEDIDRAIEGEDRDVEMDKILNTIDGIDAKSSEILVVLTTNNVEKINRAMLRPGRLDAVIPVRAPDPAAAAQLVQNYSRGLLRDDEDLTEVGAELRGMIPASIREVVERAKLAAGWRLADDADHMELAASDLVIAAKSMKTQLQLMHTPMPDKRSDIEKAAAIVADVFRSGQRRLNGPLAEEGGLPVAERVD